MRKSIAFLLITGLGLSVGACAGAAKDCKVGYLDVPRILEEYEGFREARGELDSTREKLEEEFNQRRDNLTKEGQQLQENMKLWSEAKRREKEEAYMKKAQDLQEWQIARNKELRDREEGLVKRLEADVRKVLKRIGKKGGFSFVVRGDLMLYMNESAEDLTSDVLEELRRQAQEK